MEIFILFLCFCSWVTTNGFPEISIQPFEHSEDLQDNGLLIEDILNGTTYRFSSMQDDSAITVLENGDVITDVWRNLPTQKWTVIDHPRERFSSELQQKVVRYNMLSGYEPIPDQPELYPRPLTLTKHRIMPTLRNNNSNELPPIPWQILIRGRWCLQSNGVGRPLDYSDCEYEPAPWQYWKLEVVNP